MSAKWIWYPGDFEIYHHMLLSSRRQENGLDYPCVWKICRPEHSVTFTKLFHVGHDTVFKVVSHSVGAVGANYKRHALNEDIFLPAGDHNIEIFLCDTERFPSAFIESEFINTDESWTAEAGDRVFLPVGTSPYFTKQTQDPAVFPFEYEPLTPVSTEKINGGTLYDFGKETFGIITLGTKKTEGITLVYGESRKEALDENHAIIRETLKKGDSAKRPARAFRYIFIKDGKGTEPEIKALYEYLPLEEKGSFSCDRKELNDIFALCTYTFHLNSREFFLDGIKRDRWVWSGDAYQSFMINRSLYADADITERTIRALLGKPPYRIHVNTINDYSAYLILSVYEHYYATGNAAFVKSVYPNLRELFAFMLSRLDENGLSVPVGCDWVFIDWGELDKTGPHCAEQLLLWKSCEAMTLLSAAAGAVEDFTEKAEKLKALINEKYFDAEKGAYIDSFVSGKRFVSRQTNVLAVLLGFVSGETKESIIENVFDNPDLPPITTPYFKLYELLALCHCGRLTQAQEYILSYWGGMIKEGATSVWEAYDERQTGDEHLKMYGSPYGKSLCHAWGSGPVMLLIDFCTGIEFTSEAQKTFTVRPERGILNSFRAVRPVADGSVTVEFTENGLSVTSTVPGGTLVYGGKEIPLEQNKTVTM